MPPLPSPPATAPRARIPATTCASPTGVRWSATPHVRKPRRVYGTSKGLSPPGRCASRAPPRCRARPCTPRRAGLPRHRRTRRDRRRDRAPRRNPRPTRAPARPSAPRCSGSGSSSRVNAPFGSQSSSTTVAPSAAQQRAAPRCRRRSRSRPPPRVSLRARMAATSITSSASTRSRCQSSAAVSSRSPPSASKRRQASAPDSYRCAHARPPSAADRNSPRADRNLSAFHCAGLWLAVRMMPPAARRCSTAIWVVGVVARPRSTTSRPAAMSPAATARCTIGPERRASRPTTTGPSPSSAANAAEKRDSTGGVSDSPTMPRTPATLIISGEVMRCAASKSTAERRGRPVTVASFALPRAGPAGARRPRRWRRDAERWSW